MQNEEKRIKTTRRSECMFSHDVYFHHLNNLTFGPFLSYMFCHKRASVQNLPKNKIAETYICLDPKEGCWTVNEYQTIPPPSLKSPYAHVSFDPHHLSEAAFKEDNCKLAKLRAKSFALAYENKKGKIIKNFAIKFKIMEQVKFFFISLEGVKEFIADCLDVVGENEEKFFFDVLGNAE